MKRNLPNLELGNKKENYPQLPKFTFDFIIEILFLVVVFLIPTIFDRRLGIVFSGTKVAFLRSFILVILSVWTVKLIVVREHRFVRTPLDWPVLAFLLSTAIATLTSVHVYTSFVGFYGRFEGLSTWYLFGLLFFIGTNYIKSFAQIKRVILAVTCAATIMAVYSIIQRHELDPYMWGGVVTWQRVIGTIGQPNFLAAYMLMAFFLGLALLLMEKPSPLQAEGGEKFLPLGYFLFAQIIFLFMIYTLEAHQVFVWYGGFAVMMAAVLLFVYSYEKLPSLVFDGLLGICLLLNYICILYTQSRGGYLGFFTGAVLFVGVAGRKWIFSNWEKIAILGGLIIFVSGITMLRPEFSPFERFASEITTAKEAVITGEAEARLELKGAAGSRGETWKSAFHIIADYPFFGIGPEVLKMIFPRYETELFRFKEAFHVKQDRCHNETFDVPVTKGLISFFLYGGIIFLLFYRGLKGLALLGSENKLLMAGLLSAALSYLIQNQFSFGVVAITSLFWILWALVVNVQRENASFLSAKLKVSLLHLPWLPIGGVVLFAVFLIYLSFFSFRADIYYKTGKTLLEMRRFSEAEAELKKSLAIYPFEGTTISHLGIVQLNLNQVEEAMKTLKHGTLVDAYNADNFFMLAKTHLMLAHDEEAKTLAEITIKIDPYYAEAYHLLGLIHEKKGLLAEAAKNFETTFFINPNLTEAMDRLKEVYRQKGRAEEVLSIFERAVKKYGDNFLLLEKTGRLYLDFGKLNESAILGQRLIALEPKKSVGYSFLGEVYSRQNDWENAFSHFQQALLLDPKNIFAHNGLGQIHLKKGEKEKAKGEFEQTLILDPHNALAKEMLKKL